MEKITLKIGCPGCQRKWNERGSEGQCSRCKRCLSCCGRARIPLTCAAKWADKTLPQQRRSRAAYDRWESNPNILSKNRRIV